ncbi:hypothetical protein GQ457_10G013890 [Hibiscus cannabinus]
MDVLHNETKETEIGLFNLRYENFKMNPDEDIKTMSDRFSVIINGLKGYGEVILEDKLVRKMIYSLLDSWDSKKMTIIEVKNLKTLKLDDLIEKKKEVEKKNVGIALKSTKEESDSSGGDGNVCQKVECPNLRKMSLEKKKHKSFVAT